MLAAMSLLSWSRVDGMTVFWMKTRALPDALKIPPSTPHFRTTIALTLGPMRAFAGFLDVPKGHSIGF